MDLSHWIRTYLRERGPFLCCAKCNCARFGTLNLKQSQSCQAGPDLDDYCIINRLLSVESKTWSKKKLIKSRALYKDKCVICRCGIWYACSSSESSVAISLCRGSFAFVLPKRTTDVSRRSINQRETHRDNCLASFHERNRGELISRRAIECNKYLHDIK